MHYLQYSFAPRLYIFNAFLQALIGLHDFGRIADDARATELFAKAEPEARGRCRCPTSATGRATPTADASPPATTTSCCASSSSRCARGGWATLYCDYAARYRGYQVDPPELAYTGPDLSTAEDS